jgi:hypothetical protein
VSASTYDTHKGGRGEMRRREEDGVSITMR